MFGFSISQLRRLIPILTIGLIVLHSGLAITLVELTRHFDKSLLVGDVNILPISRMAMAVIWCVGMGYAYWIALDYWEQQAPASARRVLLLAGIVTTLPQLVWTVIQFYVHLGYSNSLISWSVRLAITGVYVMTNLCLLQSLFTLTLAFFLPRKKQHSVQVMEGLRL